MVQPWTAGLRFEQLLAEWLAQHSRLAVTLVRDGMPLPSPGTSGILLAPADRHLVLQKGQLRLSREKERHSCRPSVDVLFESLAREAGPQTIAYLLTGMGIDGAAGLLALRHAGALTLAQDERTSAVFGMPKAAIDRGAAMHVLALTDFAPTLVQLSSEPARARSRP